MCCIFICFCIWFNRYYLSANKGSFIQRALSNWDLVLLVSLGFPASSPAAWMVFATHFGIAGLLGSETKLSLSDISESENSLVSSLTINHCGGEEDSPTSTPTKGSSSNWTLISMKYLLVLKLISFYPFEYSKYPTNRHSWLSGCKSFLFSVGILAQAFEPKILKWVTSGLCPLQASKWVIPSSCLWGTLF